MEEWKSIKEFENYNISNLGRVKNINSGKILSQSVRNGYYRVGLFSSPKQYSFDVHRLVALHFLNLPSNELIESAQKTKLKVVPVNHKDGNKLNNNIDNLEWTNYSINAKHSYDIGTHQKLSGENHHKSKLTEEQVLEIRSIYNNVNGRHGIYSELSRKFNISNETVRNIISRKIWKHI